MSSNNPENTLDLLSTELAKEDEGAISRARRGIVIRVALTVFIAAYMSWILGAVSKLDATELTRIASVEFEERLPDFRIEIRNYAIDQAPEIMDRAQDFLLMLPVRLREGIEHQLMEEGSLVVASVESDVDDALTIVIEDQLRALRDADPGANHEQSLDALILGISDTFRQTMVAALDEIYENYAEEVGRLERHLRHLQNDTELTEQEKIDKQLIEAWMVLVHKHRIAENLRARL